MITFQSVFSGGGLADIGAKQAGCVLVSAVEYDEKIAEVYRVNHGDHIHVAKVQAMDWHKTEASNIVWASPVCKEFSIANKDGEESAEEMSQAEAIASLIRIQHPKIFLLENVVQYRTSQSINIIRKALSENGYNFTEENVNSADFGVPQTRRRLILRAVRKGIVPPLVKTHANPLRQAQGMESLFGEEYDAVPWNGWYNAVSDLLDALPTTQFAPWQLKRLEKMNYSFLIAQDYGSWNTEDERKRSLRSSSEPSCTIKSTHTGKPKAFLYPVNGENALPLAAEVPSAAIVADHGAVRHRAFLVEGDVAGDRLPTVPNGREPAITIKATGGGRVHRAFLMDCQDSKLCGVTNSNTADPTFTIGASQDKRPARAWLEQGRVVSMNARCLARFQSVPDTYMLPNKSGLASTVIGNGVCCLLARRVIESMLDCM